VQGADPIAPERVQEKDRGVDPDSPLRLTVEIDSAEPLTGRIGMPGEPMRRFSGWLGLATHLQLFVSDGDEGARRPKADRTRGRSTNSG
jgi:hypothetical protein